MPGTSTYQFALTVRRARHVSVGASGDGLRVAGVCVRGRGCRRRESGGGGGGVGGGGAVEVVVYELCDRKVADMVRAPLTELLAARAPHHGFSRQPNFTPATSSTITSCY